MVYYVTSKRFLTEHADSITGDVFFIFELFPCLAACFCVLWDREETPTNEEDRKGAEEQEDMWHQSKSVQEAAIVQNPAVHIVGRWVVVISTEGQGWIGDPCL